MNEFVSNSVKHGIGAVGGKIDILISTADDSWSILCNDNGSAGVLDAQRAAAASGLGTRVINSLATSLGATLDWRAEGKGMELRLESISI